MIIIYIPTAANKRINHIATKTEVPVYNWLILCMLTNQITLFDLLHQILMCMYPMQHNIYKVYLMSPETHD